MTEKQTKKEEVPESEEEPTEEEQSEELSDAEFIQSMIRAPRAGIYEQLLSQHLATAALTADPLKKTRTVMAACLMVPEKDRETLAIDYEMVDVLEAVANALLFTSIGRRGWNRDIIEFITVSWGFALTEENFKKYIVPWIHTGPVFYAECLHAKFVKISRRRDFPNFCYVESINREPTWDYFFESTRFLTSEGLNLLRNQFSTWAMPKVHAYLTELTSIVSPSVYTQMLGLARRGGGKKGYAEKVKETVKPTESQTNEDSLD